MPGFQLLTQELRDRHGFQWTYDYKDPQGKERLYIALQQMFPSSADKKVDRVQSLTERYHKYKTEYVKQISFNPDNENLRKCFL